MDFELPTALRQLLAELDQFLEDEIWPLQRQDDNERFFDHRREFARTDFEGGGTPSEDWEALLEEMFTRADRAGWLRYGLPEEAGGRDGGNLDMAVIREHLAAKGLGLHNDLQNESSVVGNFPFVHMFLAFGTPEQREEFVEGMITRRRRVAFGLTEPDHGSDATWLETTAVPDGDSWILNGAKRFNSGLHSATHDVIFARTSGDGGDPHGITAFIVPTDSPGFSVDFHWWTFTMPTDHAEVTLRDVRVPAAAVFGEVGEGLALAQHFVHENRIRQAASGVGAAQYCIDRSVAYARERVTFGRPLAERQAIQWPLAELQTEAELVRTLVRKTAWELDRTDHLLISDKVSMCNYRANRLVCDAADRAMQVHGGLGYTRHTPFEHIYRHHRRYRITEGAEEIQLRRIAGYLFGFAGPGRR
ncbi:alkylation response protein AidB-like acyl-CoA dehydrogenase [Amycolatopsis bartoniae]|uniref:Acyl-CoA dehydrogenase n=1 Tax=Amycolatopsis bartoniae TaxID=941986 RepID=A0A8H9IUQ4_9PSEU|nr:acyl-CoA dehydrogenase family protein [Amycolatopsis bartoniae]MBB2937858.1 alkylation response protein AidB-like acyl-CoA dehydrogenase [Amycolatopsis bartoniae]TVT01331.1 acyl-CoA dehydrogenase family protein [Amycolatopsis bartoniae]GHF41252.1 acyl-CoA dehydrogenase [Amycolatopsis bartoniae]